MAKSTREPGWIHDWEPEDSSHHSPEATRPHAADSATSDHQGRAPHMPVSKGEALTVGARFASEATSIPGRLLIKIALMTALSTTLLGGIGVWAYSGFGWWIPLIVGLASLAITGFFILRRTQLHNALEQSGPRDVIDNDAQSLTILDENGRDPEYELRAFAQREGEAFGRARREYHHRTARFFPRIEAAQRSLRSYVDPTYDAPWLEHDIRPTLVAFIATAISIPVCGFFTVITAIALILVSGI
ncbi:MAG: hypothetical protein Q4P05_08435 [Actinomycetaceae bacterium]|nr:hypothetical protein [Actinomycetaceae bacterium]